MFVASYRNTERSAQFAIDMRTRREQQAADATKREKYLLALREVEEAERRRAEQREKLAAFAAEMRAQGIQYRHSYEVIERRACKVFKCSKIAIRGARRHREIVFARQFVMYWTCRLTMRSLPQIGRLMGGRDHTTVLHGKRQYVEKRAYMGRHLREAR